jgi:hypothetical protein
MMGPLFFTPRLQAKKHSAEYRLKACAPIAKVQKQTDFVTRCHACTLDIGKKTTKEIIY